MNFRLMPLKIIISIIVGLILGSILHSYLFPCVGSSSIDEYGNKIISDPVCAFSPVKGLIGQPSWYLIVLLFVILIYIIWSLIERGNKK